MGPLSRDLKHVEAGESKRNHLIFIYGIKLTFESKETMHQLEKETLEILEKQGLYWTKKSHALTLTRQMRPWRN